MGFVKKLFSGITENTVKNIQLNAGAFFKNYKVGTDDYESAKAAGKVLGATQGGGSVTIKPTYRQISVDGAVGRVRGLTDIDTWEISIAATVIETTVETLKLALGAAKTTAGSSGGDIPAGYTKIEGKTGVDDEDYIENITWIGTITGTDKPIIIQVFNVLNEDGLSYSVADKSEGKVGLTFYGYNSVNDFITDAVEPPFAIYYPDNNTTTGTTDTGDNV